MNRHFLVMLTLAFILVIGAACGNSNEEDQVETETEPVQNEETEQQITEENTTDVNEENNVNNETEASDIEEDTTEQDSEQTTDRAEGELPEPIELNEQIQHEKGLIFVLEEIRFEEDHIQVDFNAENHSGYAEYLASSGEASGTNLGGITLQDDTGFDYRYIAEDNARIKIGDREKINGTVSFTGTIQEDAKSITLIFNPDHNPEFAFEDLELVW